MDTNNTPVIKMKNRGKFKKGRIPWNKDKKIGKQSKGTIQKRSNAGKKWHKKIKGTKIGIERNRKISISQLGDKNNSKGKIAREKNRQAHLREKSFLWRGGISFEPYSVDWTKTLKRSIKERDKFRCQLCFNDNKLVIHHIDYNKKNSNPNNLITLCASCHGKTNTYREKWKQIFKQIMK